MKNIKLSVLTTLCLIIASAFLQAQSYHAPDFNGDGISDLGHVWSDNGSLSVSLFMDENGLNQTFTENKWVNRTGVYSLTDRWFYGDFNGDAITDLAVLWDDSGSMSCDVYISTDTNTDGIGDSFVKQSWAFQSGTFDPADRWFVGDVTGDFSDDLIRAYKDGNARSIDVYTSNGSGFDAPTTWASKQGGFNSDQVWLPGDYNGDFAMDFAVVDAGTNIGISLHLSNGSSAFSYTNSWVGYQTPRTTKMKFVSGDFNGDGFTDIANLWDDNGQVSIDVHSSTGSSFAHASWVNGVGVFEREHKWFIGDSNGDGFVDIIRLWNQNGMISVESFVSDGGTAFTPVLLMDQGAVHRDQNIYTIGDFDADFASDIAITYADSSNWYTDIIASGSGHASATNYSIQSLDDYFDRHQIAKPVVGDTFIRTRDIVGATPPGADLQSVLDSGQDLLLVRQAVYNINNTLSYRASYQTIKTMDAAFPSHYAILRQQIDLGERDTVVRANNEDYVHLENVIVDGNKYQLGQKAWVQGQGAMVQMGAADGHWIRRCVFYNTRTWSTCQIHEANGAKDSIVEYNYVLGAGNGPRGNGRDLDELGNSVPGGSGNTGWADGFSVSARNTKVRYNFIMDCTDVGVVVFGAPDSHIHDNMIFNYSRESLGGINMVDGVQTWNLGADAQLPGSDRFDYTNLTIEDNIVAASGARIQLGIPFSNQAWVPETPEVFDHNGGVIRGNHLTGDAFGYGYILSHLRNVNFQNNTSDATHSGKGNGHNSYNGEDPDPATAFLYDPDTILGTNTIQPGFTDNTKAIVHLLYMNHTPYNADGYHYYEYTDSEAEAIVVASYLEMLGRAPTAQELTDGKNSFLVDPNLGTPENEANLQTGDAFKRSLMLLSEFSQKFGAIPPANLHVFRTARWRDRVFSRDETSYITNGNFPSPSSVYNNVLADLQHPGTGSLNADITNISPALPTYMQQDDVVTVAITVQNNGSTDWVNSASNPNKFALASVGDDSTFGVTRVYIPDGATIAAGQSYVFNVEIAAPPVAYDPLSLTTTFPYDFKMVQESVAFFGESIADHLGGTHNIEVENAPAPPPPPVYDATFVSQQIIGGDPVTNGIQPGAQFMAQVTFQNTGNATAEWSADSGFFLGSENPRDNQNWGTNRGRIDPLALVQSGDNYTFDLLLTAPLVEGPYDFQWQMLGSEPGWFGGTSTSLSINVSSSAPAIDFNSADFVSINGPIYVLAGSSFTIDVTYENNGNTAWSAANGFKLGSENPQDNTIWGPSRTDMDGTVVNPGSQYTFTVNCTAPAVLGDYDFRVRMVKDSAPSAGWFGDLSANHFITVSDTPLPFNDAQFISQTVPTSVQPDVGFIATVTYENTGNTTWSFGDPAGPYKMGAQNPQDNSTWGSPRAEMDNVTTVAPGQQYTFNVVARSPATNGTYDFQWKMVQEGAGWFGEDSTNASILVDPGAPVQPFDDAVFVSQVLPTAVEPNQTFQVKLTYTNTGTTTWTVGGGYQVGSEALTDNTTWGAALVTPSLEDEAGLPISSVLPGQNGVFVFNATAPAVEGSTLFRKRLNVPGRGRFGDLSAAATILVDQNANLVRNNVYVPGGENIPTSIKPGTQFTAFFTFQNIGNTIWQFNDPAGAYKMGSENPRDNTTWGTNRVNIDGSALVFPGQTYRFAANLTAPAIAGTYDLQWQMLHEGVQWFGVTTDNFSVVVDANAPDLPLDATHVSTTVPPDVLPGSTFTAYVTYQNSGSQTWTGVSGIKLISQSPEANTFWGAAESNLTGTVAPGENITFEVVCTAPLSTGTYAFQRSMYIDDGVNAPFPFGDYSTTQNINVTTTPVAYNAARPVSVVTTANGKVHPGENYLFEVTMKNTGNTTWSLSDPAGPYKLGSVNDDMTWANNRQNVVSGDSILPGENYTFYVEVTAPLVDGVYPFHRRMVQDGVGWFGETTDIVNVTVDTNEPPPPPPPFNDSQFISQVVPTTVEAGADFIGSVTFENTGNTTWSAADSYIVGAENPRDNSDWKGGRLLMEAGASVAPGQQYTFNFTLTAPATVGQHNFQRQMLQDGVEWFGQTSLNVVVDVTTPADFQDARFVIQDVPSIVYANSSFDITMTYENTGNTTWTAGDPAGDYTLGEQNPQDNNIWQSGRIALTPGSVVAPGEFYTFTIPCIAPAIEGTYNFQRRILQDGVEWFGEFSPNVVIIVQAPADNFLTWDPWPGNPGDPGTARGEDFDGDGKTNEYEYYFGSDPVDSSNTGEPIAVVDSNSPAITFTYRTDDVNTTYYVDTSEDLVTWQLDQRASMFTDVNAPTNNGTTATVTIRYNSDYSTLSTGKLFIRVRAEDPSL